VNHLLHESKIKIHAAVSSPLERKIKIHDVLDRLAQIRLGKSLQEFHANA
jgi:hypothetical protein